MRRSLTTLGLPAGVYLAVVVVAPGLNGGFGNPAFWTHGAWVLGVVVVCLAVVATVLLVANRHAP